MGQTIRFISIDKTAQMGPVAIMEDEKGRKAFDLFQLNQIKESAENPHEVEVALLALRNAREEQIKVHLK